MTACTHTQNIKYFIMSVAIGLQVSLYSNDELTLYSSAGFWIYALRIYVCMSVVKIVAVFFYKYECQLKKVYINYCTATHVLSYYDDISNYPLSVYKSKARQTFGNLYLLHLWLIFLYRWLRSRQCMIDDECSLHTWSATAWWTEAWEEFEFII